MRDYYDFSKGVRGKYVGKIRANLKRGDFVWIERDGQREKAMVTLASENGNSLMVMFDAMFHGYAGMMPLLRQGGIYLDLIENRVVKVEKIEE